MKPSSTARDKIYHSIRGKDKGKKLSIDLSKGKKLTRKKSTGKIKTVRI